MKSKIIIGICIISLLAIIVSGSYTPPDYDDVNLTFDTGYSSPPYDSVNLTFGEITDTCSPTGNENHIMSCSDGCNITTDLDLGNFNLTFNGTGTITFDANLSNVNYLTNDGTGCIVIFNENIN